MTKKPEFVGPPIEGKSAVRWHPETFWCSLKGHAAPADAVRTVDDDSYLVAIRIDNNAHMSRCLRCDVWILTDQAGSTEDSLYDLAKIKVPKRGKALRDAIVLKLIAVDRGLHSFIFTVVFIGILLLETHLGGLQNTARHLVDNATNTINNTGQGSSQNYTTKELQRFISLKSGSLNLLLITAGAYAVVEGVEAFGLWGQKRWAEYLTALATAGFLPLEINELLKRVTVLRVGALVINLAVLIYLLWAKRLFGIRGGSKEDSDLILSADQVDLLPGQPRPDPATS